MYYHSSVLNFCFYYGLMLVYRFQMGILYIVFNISINMCVYYYVLMHETHRFLKTKVDNQTQKEKKMIYGS